MSSATDSATCPVVGASAARSAAESTDNDSLQARWNNRSLGRFRRSRHDFTVLSQRAKDAAERTAAPKDAKPSARLTGPDVIVPSRASSSDRHHYSRARSRQSSCEGSAAPGLPQHGGVPQSAPKQRA